MKKILLVFGMLMSMVAANAQFTVYESVGIPQSTRRPSMGYGTPFTIYEPVFGDEYTPRRTAPRMQEVTLTGYYEDYKGWHSTPIRVGVTGDQVKLLSIKTQYGWSNCGSVASEVGGFDAEVVRDNFNYKAFSSGFGTVYF